MRRLSNGSDYRKKNHERCRRALHDPTSHIPSLATLVITLYIANLALVAAVKNYFRHLMAMTLPSPHRSSSPTPSPSNANHNVMVSVARIRGEDSSSLSKETTIDKQTDNSSQSHSRKRQRAAEDGPLELANLEGYSDGVLNAVKQFQDILNRQEQWHKRWHKRGALIRNHVAASHRDMYDDWLADADLFRDQMESHTKTLMAILRRTE